MRRAAWSRCRRALPRAAPTSSGLGRRPAASQAKSLELGFSSQGVPLAQVGLSDEEGVVEVPHVVDVIVELRPHGGDVGGLDVEQAILLILQLPVAVDPTCYCGL